MHCACLTGPRDLPVGVPGNPGRRRVDQRLPGCADGIGVLFDSESGTPRVSDDGDASPVPRLFIVPEWVAVPLWFMVPELEVPEVAVPGAGLAPA